MRGAQEDFPEGNNKHKRDQLSCSLASTITQETLAFVSLEKLCVCLVMLAGNIFLEDAPILVPFFPLSCLFDLLTQEMDLLVHLENALYSDSIDALIGQFGDLFKDCDILIRIEAILPRLPRWLHQSGFFIPAQHLWRNPDQFGDNANRVFGQALLFHI
jgi:hypothetical protein